MNQMLSDQPMFLRDTFLSISDYYTKYDAVFAICDCYIMVPGI